MNIGLTYIWVYMVSRERLKEIKKMMNSEKNEKNWWKKEWNKYEERNGSQRRM